jgi:hypothetical protein
LVHCACFRSALDAHVIQVRDSTVTRLVRELPMRARSG